MVSLIEPTITRVCRSVLWETVAVAILFVAMQVNAAEQRDFYSDKS